MQLEEIFGAIKDFSKAIKINPKFETAYINRGLAKHEWNYLDGAIDDFNKAIEINPYSFDSYFSMAQCKEYWKDF